MISCGNTTVVLISVLNLANCIRTLQMFHSRCWKDHFKPAHQFWIWVWKILYLMCAASRFGLYVERQGKLDSGGWESSLPQCLVCKKCIKTDTFLGDFTCKLSSVDWCASWFHSGFFFSWVHTVSMFNLLFKEIHLEFLRVLFQWAWSAVCIVLELWSGLSLFY